MSGNANSNPESAARENAPAGAGANNGAGASSSAALNASARPGISRGFRLQFEPAQNAHVLLYPEGMVKLNGSAGEILKRCDGERTMAEIIADLETTYGATGLAKDVNAFVAWAIEQKWLEMRA